MPTSVVRRLINAPLNRLAIALGVRIERHRAAIGRATLPAFATDATGLVMMPPFELRHPRRISIGRDVRLGPNCSLKLTTRYPGPWMASRDGRHIEQEFDPHLIIGDRVTATSALQVTVYDSVIIDADVLFASNVYLSDGSHSLARGDRPYKYQGIDRVSPVRIGRGAWIGQNAVILPGVTIGAFAVIGANSVVTADVPAGAIAVGAPAKVVRLWDPSAEAWTRVGDGRSSERVLNPEGARP